MSCSVEELERQLSALCGSWQDYVLMRYEERGGFECESVGSDKGRIRWLTRQIEELEDRIEDKQRELRERRGEVREREEVVVRA